MTITPGIFSAPAEVQTFEGVLSDFDGTIVDSTDGMRVIPSPLGSMRRRYKLTSTSRSDCEALAPVSEYGPMKAPKGLNLT
jgi:glycerol 3-phosphatase-1